MAAGTDNARLRKLFCGKVGQMADSLAASAKALRATPPSPDAPEQVYHVAHSLHGAGTMYGFPCISEMGACLEDLVKAVMSGRRALTQDVIDLIECCAAALRDVAASDDVDEAAAARISEVAWKCECALHDAAGADPPPSQTTPQQAR